MQTIAKEEIKDYVEVMGCALLDTFVPNRTFSLILE
jgi:hypothetical protein